MNQSSENEFFEITLTPSGSTYLLRLYNLTKAVFILAILTTLIFLTDTWLQNKIYARNYGSMDGLSYVMVNIYPIFVFVLAVIGLIQVYFFLHFARLCNKAIRQQQTELFNDSFKWLFRNTVTACILFALELAARCFFLYGKFIMMQNLHLN